MKGLFNSVAKIGIAVAAVGLAGHVAPALIGGWGELGSWVVQNSNGLIFWGAASTVVGSIGGMAPGPKAA